MPSDHLPPDRIRQLMVDSAELTEQESDHINGWKCAECEKTMRKILAEDSDEGAANPDPSD